MRNGICVKLKSYQSFHLTLVKRVNQLVFFWSDTETKRLLFNISFHSSSASLNRKFADIEAANHRLASALCFREEEQNASSPPSQHPETLDQSGGPPGCYLQDPDKRTDVDGISKTGTDVSVASQETEISKNKQPDSTHLWKRHQKSQRATGTGRENNHNTERQKKEKVNPLLSSSLSSTSSPKSADDHHRAELLDSECYDNESHRKSANNLSEDSPSTQQESDLLQFNQNVDTSPSSSPELSPLSLDSCDFSIQMFTDISTRLQAQKSISGISESQWTDILDIFSVGSKDPGGCMDVETYFESICACQGDAGQEVVADGFADQSESLGKISEMEDLRCETGEYRYQYRCHGDWGSTPNRFQSPRRSFQVPKGNGDPAETQFNHFKPNQETEVVQDEFPTPVAYHYHNQHPQVESSCMLVNCENNQNLTPFEGVAQSFSVPLHNPEYRPIPTPPHEDEWLFTDILKDRKSLDC